jgi:hypothetical protein
VTAAEESVVRDSRRPKGVSLTRKLGASCDVHPCKHNRVLNLEEVGQGSANDRHGDRQCGVSEEWEGRKGRGPDQATNAGRAYPVTRVSSIDPATLHVLDVGRLPH